MFNSFYINSDIWVFITDSKTEHNSIVGFCFGLEYLDETLEVSSAAKNASLIV